MSYSFIRLHFIILNGGYTFFAVFTLLRFNDVGCLFDKVCGVGIKSELDSALELGYGLTFLKEKSYGCIEICKFILNIYASNSHMSNAKCQMPYVKC